MDRQARLVENPQIDGESVERGIDLGHGGGWIAPHAHCRALHHPHPFDGRKHARWRLFGRIQDLVWAQNCLERRSQCHSCTTHSRRTDAELHELVLPSQLAVARFQRRRAIRRSGVQLSHGDTVYVDPNLVGHDYYALLRREGIREPAATSRPSPLILTSTLMVHENKRRESPEFAQGPWTRWRTTSSDVSRFQARR